MGRKRRTEFEDSLCMNMFTWRQYFDRLRELSMTMFEWVNLPETVDERFLEKTLFERGNCIFFKDEDLDLVEGVRGSYLTLQSANYGQFDVYNIPKQRRAFASNGYQKDLDDTNSVIIYNNYLRKNNRLDVEMFSKRLYNIDRAIDTNINAQKTPILLLCNENERMTYLNLYKEYDGNAPVIKGTKGLDLDAFTVLKTDAPFVARDLYELKSEYWNEALTYLGISNVNTTKKERMVTDEVIRNMGGTIASRYSRLEMRRQACEQINKMFGLDIWCNYRADYREADDEIMLAGDTEDNAIKQMVADLNTDTRFRPKERGEL